MNSAPQRGSDWFNWPNRLTIGRILLVGPLFFCLLNLHGSWSGWRPLALVLFAAMALSDALDGFLARRLGAETPIGRFLDPVADKLLVTCAVIVLAVDATALPGFVLPSWVPVIAVSKDMLIVIGFVLLYATTGEFFIQPRIWGKVCTLIQLLLVAYVLVGPSLPPDWPNGVTALSLGASAMAVLALADYIRVGSRFAAERSKPPERKTDHE